MELLIMVVTLLIPPVIAFVATDRDRKDQWRGWTS